MQITRAVFGLYNDRAQVAEAVDRMARSGIALTEISVLLSDSQSSKNFADEKHTHEPEGIAGATSGGFVGETLGLLVGLSAIAIPGGPYVGTGPMITLLNETGESQSVSSLHGALLQMGLSEESAASIEAKINGGCALLSIHCAGPGEVQRAEALLSETGADNISFTAAGAPLIH